MKKFLWLLLAILGIATASYYKKQKNDASAPIVRNTSTETIEGGEALWREIAGNEIVDQVQILIKDKTGLSCYFGYYDDEHIKPVWTLGVYLPMNNDLYDILAYDGPDPNEAYKGLIENLPEQYFK